MQKAIQEDQWSERIKEKKCKRREEGRPMKGQRKEVQMEGKEEETVGRENSPQRVKWKETDSSGSCSTSEALEALP